MNEETVREWFAGSGDVRISANCMGEGQESQTVVMAYCEGMVDRKLLNEIVFPRLDSVFRDIGEDRTLASLIESRMEAQRLDGGATREAVALKVYSGELLLSFPNAELQYSVSIANTPQRKPEESSTEISIKGPRDAFTEDAVINVALVRKRLKSASMRVEKFTLGSRSNTSVFLLYIHDIAEPNALRNVRERLKTFDTDGVVGIAQLEEGLTGAPYSLFPLLDYIGRPDYAAASLLAGRFAVIADGTPMALIGPCNLTSLLISPEDAHLPFYFVSMERVLRIVGLLLALFLPGFWVSVSAFNLDQIPFPLLATITTARIGLPISGPLDLFLMLAMFEVFREAGVRLPKAVGQTVAVVGGLIIGDAAIQAGITSPTTLVVTAVSTVATFTLINQTLVGSVSVLRIGLLLMASTFGMFGLIAGSLGLLLYLASLKSFGVPYLAPIAPFHRKDLWQSLLAKPWKNRARRPTFLHPTDPKRGGKR
ncbi:spore germination protein [Paenibacillus antri]|uniref:Spore germination protein n=1 Tax=Paenibacillus antri TaxID=2582848 RepID=A0A5R9GDC7_9BACL|nr:spore germination protein [Paenibacillus antri]TLS52336.1 spore germination protein [Paenibacillus antri]